MTRDIYVEISWLQGSKITTYLIGFPTASLSSSNVEYRLHSYKD